MSRGRGYPVLVHGFTGSSASWTSAVVDGLAGAGFPPVLVDLPGHGRHAREGGVVDLDQALSRVGAAGGETFDLIGYSMGGRVALHYAAAHPARVRRLVLESASPGLPTEGERASRRAADEALASKLTDEGIEAFVEHWEGQPLFASRRSVDAGELARQREIRLRNEPAGLAAALRALGTGALPSLWEGLGEITAPTLLVVGELDPKYVDIARRMASRMPRAEVVEVRGAGHTVHLERSADWLAAVTDFLADPS